MVEVNYASISAFANHGTWYKFVKLYIVVVCSLLNLWRSGVVGIGFESQDKLWVVVLSYSERDMLMWFCYFLLLKTMWARGRYLI